MRIPKDKYDVPVAPTVQMKPDLVDRDGLDGMRCDLDYAPPLELPERIAWRIGSRWAMATIAATVLTWLFGQYPLPWILQRVPVTHLCAAIGLTALIAAIRPWRTLRWNVRRVSRSLLLTVWAVATAAMTPLLLHTSGAMVWLTAVAVPGAIWFAYRFTTFGVYWITAHPLADGPTMWTLRDLWKYRHEGVPTNVPADIQNNRRDAERWRRMLRAVRSYDYGGLWCYAAIWAGTAFAWLAWDADHRDTLGLRITTSILVALLGVALIRCRGRLPLRLFGALTLRWLFYNANDQSTPWMLQSPCGEVGFRWRWAFLTLALVAVATNNLAGAFAPLVMTVSKGLAVGRGQWTLPLFAVLTCAVFCLVIPVVVLVLLLLIVGGPALKAFDDLYTVH